MSDNLEPRPGDVWESPRGTIVFIFKSGSGTLSAIEMFGGTAGIGGIDELPSYTLRFRNGKPVPQPQPDGETVTRHGVAYMCRDGSVHFQEMTGMKLKDWLHGISVQVLGEFDVAIPTPKIPVLPTVNVTGQ